MSMNGESDSDDQPIDDDPSLASPSYPLLGDRRPFFREVLPSRTSTASSSAKSWRDVIVNTGAAQGTLQDIKRPEACGGYAYADNRRGHDDVSTRNRFVYWRVNHDVLELSEESMDVDLIGGCVSVRFQDTPVLDGVSVHELDDIDVVVLVATVSSVHRIVLPHPRRLDASTQLKSIEVKGAQHSLPSIFADLTAAVMLREPSSYHVLNLSAAATSPAPHTSACWLSASGEAHFALASGSGCVLHVRLAPHRRSSNRPVDVDSRPGSDVVVTELRKSNVIRRVLTGVLPAVMRGGVSNQAHDAPLSLCFDCSNGAQLLFTLCRDCQVRVWSIDTLQCIIECDLFPFLIADYKSLTSRLLSTGQRHVLKKCDGDYCQITKGGCILLVVALYVANCRNFVLLKLVRYNGSDECDLDYVTTIKGHTHNLIDFALTATHIWALWSTSHSETVLCYASVNTSEELRLFSAWKDVILESTDSLDGHHLPEFPRVDPREEYCEHIFYPGRFSINTISKATFNTFRRSADLSHASDFGGSSIAVLRDEVTSAVEAELQNCASEYEVADDVYIQLQQECWAKFYSGCLQFHQVEMKPMGIFVDANTELVYYIKKGSVSVLRPCDFVEIFSKLCDGACNIVSVDLHLSPACLQTSDVDDPVSTVFQCLHELRTNYSTDFKSDFKHELYYLVSPEIVAESVLDDILETSDKSISEKSLPESDHVVKKLKGFIQRVKGHLSAAVEAVLDAVDLTPLSTSRDSDLANMMDVQIDEAGIDSTTDRWSLLAWSHRHLFGSTMGTSLLAESVLQIAEARMDVCRDLLVLLTILIQSATEVGLSADMVEELKSRFVPRTCLLTQAYFVVIWICETVASPIPVDTIDEDIRHLEFLNLSDGVQPYRPYDFDSHSSRLIEIFARHEGGRKARLHLSRANVSSGTRSTLWSNSFAPLVSLLLEQVWPITVNCLFMECLLKKHQHLQIQEYDRLLRPWCEWNSCSRKFACGYSHLVQGRPHAAFDWFADAADGAVSEEFIVSRLHGPTTDGDPSELVLIFYCKCIRLFEQFQYPEHVILMADKALEAFDQADNSHLPTLWALRFKYCLELERNVEAFDALLKNPDRSRQVTCLRQLVIVLFERRQLKTLIEFSYRDLEDEVVEIMEQRARTIDLNVHNYYELLYSFHVHRANFRRAGSMMYEYGMRVGNEVGGVRGLQRQAKCYLAAMNALAIVGPEHAWLVKPFHADTQKLAPTTDTGAASPKRSYDGEELPPLLGLKQQIALVELKDIRLEYELVLARLQLIKRDNDPAIGQGPGYTADETVIHLAKAGLFDKAIHICKAFCLPLQPVIETLVSKCVHLTRAMALADPSSMGDAWDWLAYNEIPGQGHAQGNNACDHAWLLLKSYLEHHEQMGQVGLHKCAAIRLLSLGSRLPTWLLAVYKTRDVADLLRIYLRFGLLEDAARLVLEYIDAVLSKGKEYFGLRVGLEAAVPSVWIPYTSIDTLLEIMDRNPSNLTLANLKDALMAKLIEYQDQAAMASRRMVLDARREHFAVGKMTH